MKKRLRLDGRVVVGFLSSATVFVSALLGLTVLARGGAMTPADLALVLVGSLFLGVPLFLIIAVAAYAAINAFGAHRMTDYLIVGLLAGTTGALFSPAPFLSSFMALGLIALLSAFTFWITARPERLITKGEAA